MNKLLLTLLLLVPFLAIGYPIPDHLEDVSVTIVAGKSQGSGVVFMRGGQQYVWTAGHVVAGCRQVHEVEDPALKMKYKHITFAPVEIVRAVVEHGQIVGVVSAKAEVIKYSNCETGRDLALLKVVGTPFTFATTEFYLGDEIPGIATEVLHVGSFLGFVSGGNSFSTGVISYVGRIYGDDASEQQIYDQTSVVAFPGSSGGGVFLKSDGRYIGMLVRGNSDCFHIIVPIREMVRWAKVHDIYWAIDPQVPITAIHAIEDTQEADRYDKSIIERIRESFRNKTAQLNK